MKRGEFQPSKCSIEALMDKDEREALQVAKELTAKFIETRTVSPTNFHQIFPAIYSVVLNTIAGGSGHEAERGE